MREESSWKGSRGGKKYLVEDVVGRRCHAQSLGKRRNVGIRSGGWLGLSGTCKA